MKNNYSSSNHCKFLIQYHIIWCPKFRYPVLKDEAESTLKNILSETCDEYRYEIKALEVMPDHIHMFVSAPHTVAPSDIVRTLKSVSAIKMFREFPELKKFYSRCGRLWGRGTFISTVGHISEDIVKQYIEEQKTKD